LNVIEDEGMSKVWGFVYREMGMTYWLEQAETEIRELG